MIPERKSYPKKKSFIQVFLRSFLSLPVIFIIFSLLYLNLPLSHIYAEENIESLKAAQPTELPHITAESYYVLDYDSGEVLCKKNSGRKLYPASTTKMITAIIAIENIKDMDKTVKISPNASGRNNSFFAFNTGDEISLKDLLKCALICSHNNATIALAEFISGSEEEFIKLMNKKAIELGAYNTNFQNTNGLDSQYPEHKSTAEDLAIMAKYCLKNDLFRELVSKKKDYIKINGELEVIYNTNILLFFDYIKGVKTGFTNNAGHCQVLYSQRGDLNLITVVLNSEQDRRSEDLLKLINWANDNYKNLNIIDSGKNYKPLGITNTKEYDEFIYTNTFFIDTYPENDYKKLVNVKDDIMIKDNLQPVSEDLYIAETLIELPLEGKQKVGTVEVLINDNKETEINLIAKDNILNPYIHQNLKVEENDNLKYLLIFLIVFYFLVFIIIIVKNLLLKRRNN